MKRKIKKELVLRGRNLKRKIRKIELAPTDKVEKYQKEIDIVLNYLGHPEALVTDETMIGDFLEFLVTEKELKSNDRKLKKIAKKLGFQVSDVDYLVDVAEKIRKNKNE